MAAGPSSRLMRKYERAFRSLAGLEKPTTTRNAGAFGLMAYSILAAYAALGMWFAVFLNYAPVRVAWAMTGFASVASSLSWTRYVGFTSKPTPAECGSYESDGSSAFATSSAGGVAMGLVCSIGASLRGLGLPSVAWDAILVVLCAGAAVVCMHEEKLERLLFGPDRRKRI